MSFPYEITLPDVSASRLYENTDSIMMISSLDESYFSVIVQGMYDDLSWSAQTPPLDDPNITTWGIKMLPGAGPFYFANNEAGVPTLDHLNAELPSVSEPEI